MEVRRERKRKREGKGRETEGGNSGGRLDGCFHGDTFVLFYMQRNHGVNHVKFRLSLSLSLSLALSVFFSSSSFTEAEGELINE